MLPRLEGRKVCELSTTSYPGSDFCDTCAPGFYLRNLLKTARDKNSVAEGPVNALRAVVAHAPRLRRRRRADLALELRIGDAVAQLAARLELLLSCSVCARSAPKRILPLAVKVLRPHALKR